MIVQHYTNLLPEYLAGFLNESDQAEVEKALAHSQELRTELNEIEQSLETYAQKTAQRPFVDFSDSIWNTLNSETDAIKFAGISKSRFWYSSVGIAASVLLLASVIGNIYLGREWQFQKNNFKAVLAEKNEVEAKLNDLQQQADLSMSEVSILKNPDIKVCKLISVQETDNRSLLLGIDTKNDMQILVMSPELPEKPSGHSYQLWAIDKQGTIVCMGTFDAAKKIYKMKHLPFNPKEFGVTIEEGKLGKPQPTTDFLVRGI